MRQNQKKGQNEIVLALIKFVTVMLA